MRSIILSALLLGFAASLSYAMVLDGRPVQPVTTYSIVARDPDNGQLGVAVQSHWFSVGPVVPWVQAGVGAVATQSLTEISYGPLGLELMRGGKTATQALSGLLRIDENPQWRQVGMIDAAGNRGVHTGRKCIREAGHVSGENFICMANLMERNTVWQAMADAFRSTKGDLADRMLAALEAAQAEGGDIRGRQSAAMIIVSGEPTGVPYKDKIFDLRIEDHPNPVKELRRLVAISRAYKFMNDGDERLAENDAAGALKAYSRAMQLAPQITEIQFWSALTLFTNGREEEALENFKQVFAKEKKWIEVVRRLPYADLLKNDAGQLDKILNAAE
ncbi:MAG: DUF1028 domain-containing protein [Candidatus Krumholzibacteria bacterium]|nr:DUF1028 domain-containing protein [Candidatus Krumholzibacteria bacterium]